MKAPRGEVREPVVLTDAPSPRVCDTEGSMTAARAAYEREVARMAVAHLATAGPYSVALAAHCAFSEVPAPADIGPGPTRAETGRVRDLVRRAVAADRKHGSRYVGPGYTRRLPVHHGPVPPRRGAAATLRP
jgi:hypothetical protein